jgi:hypothetical protein
MLESIKATLQYIGTLFLCTLAGAIPFYIMHVMGVLK